ASMPKQYLPLLGQPIALYSEKLNVDLKFALPGKERQDSVFNGFQVVQDAWVIGAAVLGVPVKATIKEFCGADAEVEIAGPAVLSYIIIYVLCANGLIRLCFFVYLMQVTTPDDLLLAERILNMEVAVAS
ncbi:hypothetical protein BHE74_00007233, partial [Ensete ventricosum]